MTRKSRLEALGETFADAVEQVAVEVEPGVIVIDCEALGRRMRERLAQRQRVISQGPPKPRTKRPRRRSSAAVSRKPSRE